MYRAPAAPNLPRGGGDFLLLRSVGGAMSLREISGYVTVGQQHPLMSVPAPGSAQVRHP